MELHFFVERKEFFLKVSLVVLREKGIGRNWNVEM